MSKKAENPGECDCCNFVTRKLEYFEKLDTTIAGGGKVIKSEFWFCELCCSTQASNVYRYPGQYEGGARAVTATVCYVGNAILAALTHSAPATNQSGNSK